MTIPSRWQRRFRASSDSLRDNVNLDESKNMRTESEGGVTHPMARTKPLMAYEMVSPEMARPVSSTFEMAIWADAWSLEWMLDGNVSIAAGHCA